jgi:hypothetical protein
MKKQTARSLDLVDKLTLPMLAVTMAAEYWALKSVPKRTFGDLRDADEQTLSGTQLPADPLLPVGYERRDTVASLSMLAGSIVIGFATATTFAKFDRYLFKHRVSAPHRQQP